MTAIFSVLHISLIWTGNHFNKINVQAHTGVIMLKKLAAYLLIVVIALSAALAYAADGKSFATSGAGCCGSLSTDHD
jgi:hypothetical protein